MTLDKNKKYEFAGDVYEQGSRDWYCGERSWEPTEFQFFANKGLVKEVREPIVGRGRVTFNYDGCINGGCVRDVLQLDKEQVRNRTFDIVATEVVE